MPRNEDEWKEAAERIRENDDDKLVLPDDLVDEFDEMNVWNDEDTEKTTKS